MANRNADLISYCRKMSMSYSYKPVLIMALVDHHGSISIDEAANCRLFGLRPPVC